MNSVIFTNQALLQFERWIKENPRKAAKIMKLIKAIAKNPAEGLGNPEKLKYELQGYCSRRIDKENRLVYKIEDNKILIISCKYHYDK